MGLFTLASCHAAQVVWKDSLVRAVDAARNSGRLILLLAGRDTCGNCQYMKSTACESATVKPVLTDNFVAWYCPVDSSTEWHHYAQGLGSFTLPLMCVIDPGNPTAFLDRTTATQTITVFRDRLSGHLPARPISVSVARSTPAELRWTTEASLKYRVLRSDDLLTWTYVGTLLSGNGGPLDFAAPPGGNQEFYRVIGFR
jgi:hypothetical protein